MRRCTAGSSACSFQAYMADCTSRNTASPQAKDNTMNSGASTAEA